MLNVLVTGGTGFLGKRLVKLLVENNFNVIDVSRKDTREDLKKYFESQKINYVVHVATCYGYADDSFGDVARANLVLPLDLIDLSLKFGVEAFINTDTFFNNDLGLPVKQKSYITTKKLFLEIAKVALANSNIKFINMRIEQMYGPGDNKNKFVITVLNTLLANQSDLDLTKGQQKRDFIYVDDAAGAFVKVLQHCTALDSFEEFGVGTGESISILDAVEEMKKITKSNTKLNWAALPYRANEIMESRADISKNNKINWRPTCSFSEGMALTIDFVNNQIFK